MSRDHSERRALKTIAVFGEGIVARLSALALARTLPTAKIIFVKTGRRVGVLNDSWSSCQPSLVRFHSRLGIEERDLVQRGSGTHRLALCYEQWNASGSPWYVGYGAIEDIARLWPIHPIERNNAHSDGAHTIAACLATRNLMARPSDHEGSPLNNLDYALRFDPDAYCAGLASLLARQGVQIIAGEPRSYRKGPAGDISTVAMLDGSEVSADLYIDAMGAGERNLSDRSSTGWIDWSDMLPVKRLFVSMDRARPSMDVLDKCTACNQGWLLQSPRRDGTEAILALDDAVELSSALAAADGMLPSAEAWQKIDLSPGRLEMPFSRNVIVLGDAAAQYEPLAWTNLHLAVLSIELLLELLPGNPISDSERREYNRRWAWLADRTADYVRAHYAGTRVQGSFWKRAAALDMSTNLAKALAEFERRARLPTHGEDSVQQDQWCQLLLGHGVPASPNARQLAMGEDERQAIVRDFRHKTQMAKNAGQAYGDWLSQNYGVGL